MIWKDYKNNIQSYRDLPILLNQWSNVIRWEKKNKFFIRNNEFFLQEAHSGHINKKQSLNEIKKIINLYKLFFKKYLALYTYSGLKSKLEKFSGSNFTYTFEILTKEKKSLQIATIHFLGTNFSKPYKIKFNNIKNKYKYIWSNSWGTSSRLIGSLCMTHVDKYGLILPPKIAPIKIIILLIIKNNYKKYKEMNQYIKKILYILKNNKINFLYKKVKTNIKQTMNKYENMGIPIRFNIGINEYNNNTIEVFRRDTYRIESIKFFNIIKYINNIFTIIQKKLYNKNKKFTLNNIYKINNNNNINNLLIKKKLFLLNWDGLKKTENYIKKKFKLTLRCIPCKYLFYNIKKNKSIISNKYTFLKAYFSKSY
ncbi:MAG: aminoacyl--tRNA ligase-related protein [Candidatus Shikimatogenerans sp. AspAUS03]